MPDGDICGRYAWTQGPVSSSIPQYYPRDFNIVTLAGDLWNFQDVWGPVAVNGNLGSANGFELNSGSRGLPVAAFVEGSLSLTSGTILWKSVLRRQEFQDSAYSYNAWILLQFHTNNWLHLHHHVQQPHEYVERTRRLSCNTVFPTVSISGI